MPQHDMDDDAFVMLAKMGLVSRIEFLRSGRIGYFLNGKDVTEQWRRLRRELRLTNEDWRLTVRHPNSKEDVNG